LLGGQAISAITGTSSIPTVNTDYSVVAISDRGSNVKVKVNAGSPDVMGLFITFTSPSVAFLSTLAANYDIINPVKVS
jgi:hypothetical protein